MVQRLERSGLRSIGPLVDVTNYVLLELGQPLHAFDLAKIQGGIVARFAKAGEVLALLNEQIVKLEADMLVIADQAKPLALAGIMGGADSAVGDDTTDIFLESAFFSPGVIAGRSRRLGFGSDSSYRFERGVDFGATPRALDRATQLIVEICGGQPGPVTEAVAELPPRPPVKLRVKRVKRVLGIALDSKTIGDMLGRLGLAYSEGDGVFEVVPPSYRFDLAIEEDLIEEVARLYGYDNVPAHPPKAAMTMLPATESARGLVALKRLLVDREYQEIVSYAFVNEAWERDFAANAEPVRLLNPIAAHMSVMRSTLVGGLVDTLRANLNRKQSRVRVFESGRCFAKSGEGFVQPNRIGGLCYGAAVPEQWGEAARPVDFYDVKADVEALLWPAVARFEAAEHPAFHPGQSARIFLGGEAIGWVGVLHPKWRQAYDLPAAPALFELDLEPLLQREKPVYREVSKFPPVRRDLALLVKEETPVQDLLDALFQSLPETVVNLTLFDVYRGKGVDSDKKSLAFSVLLQDTRKTLTDEEVDAAIACLVQVLTTRFDAKLRT
jgi:phenylalanyl-tRNA synthetase beta chain